MSTRKSTLLSPALFKKISGAYRRLYGLPLVGVDIAGRAVYSSRGACRCARHPSENEFRRRAVLEALRFGEPCVNLCPHGCQMWAAPRMRNSELLGGLVVAGVPLPGDREADQRARLVHEASLGLLRLAEKHNLTNRAFLELRRLETNRERERAEAIHFAKNRHYDDIREIYLREEPALLAAIKRGERKLAREIINRVLVGIYSLARDRFDLLKSFALELVVMMSRAAVEAGSRPAGALGANYESLCHLAEIKDEEQLSRWLADMLERLMDAIRDNRQYPNTVLLYRALNFMREHLAEDLDRNAVARAAGLSPSHFSHLMREKAGRSFTDLMLEYRVDRARELLRRTDKDLAPIALECGFYDQSHFTKAFRKHTGLTPRQYRRQRQPGDER